ncbi:N-acetylmuramoyl-L-alanine amidase [Pseudomonas sp. GD04042]|uniref:N-acetylmuramoyl-L-alanine amidase n=2 Tax=Pseudomonas TaxID=286 RepID=UPI00244B994F|nr:N-acetylmuramoyl-L-alanine amidase [Pseudomonas sp. GD04042]MDG9928120.1 N-acetylmuramoyl-L-alanine amidase [Pseudomonas sp. GD04042]
MKAVALVLSALLLAGCASGLRIDDSLRAQGQSSRVQYIVLHYTSTDLLRSLALLTRGEVSAHYLIDDGSARIYRLVDEDRRAWHAGDSEWQGRTWLNASTIGIELVNQGYYEGPAGRYWQPYGEAQIEALIALLKDLVKRHDLPVDSIIGHSDIAPQRKVDPGPLFPWKRLADAGLIRWPEPAAVAREQARFAAALPEVIWFQEQLHKLGYAVPRTGILDQATRNVLIAFQMKYRPARYDGEPDAESAAILQVLQP